MILVVGAGAVGTVLATALSAAGRDLGLYARARDVERLAAINTLRVDVPDGRPPLLAPRPPLVTSLDLAGVSQVLIGVKYRDLPALLAEFPDPLPATCTLVSMLNGVASLRLLREQRPAARTVPMSVMFNSQVEGPLHARLTTRAEIVLGSADARVLAPYRDIGLLMKTARGDEAAWGKLLINLANALCALTGTTFKDLFCDPDLRRVYVAVLDEATAVLDAARIAWKLPLALPYRAYRGALLHGGPLPWWFARYRNGVREGAYPSMVADVQAGRRTEVEQLNGEIARLGRETGFATPINRKVFELLEATLTPPRLAPAGLRSALAV